MLFVQYHSFSLTNGVLDLTPFWNAQTSYWESTEVTATSTLGYSYPEFNGLDLADKNAVRRAITQKINQLYSGSAFFGLGSASLASASVGASAPKGVSATGQESLVSSLSVSASAPAQANQPAGPDTDGTKIPPIEPSPGGGNSYLDWTARIHVKKYALGGSFSVLLFIGEVPEDPEEWYTSPSFVGAHSAFVNGSAERCENCRVQREAGIVTEGFVHLNNGIIRNLRVSSFDEDVMEPLLKENLHWRIQKVRLSPSLSFGLGLRVVLR